MATIAYISLTIYCIALGYILFYCLLQFHLLYYYKRNKHQELLDFTAKDQHSFPVVTIQLPIFNELYVTERLIDHIVKLDYPKERLQIQVLDDSTDETAEISKRKVAEYAAQGYDIEWMHRVDRSGYKAGALKSAMPTVKGEFIAIFDADFLPRTDFLLKTLNHFQDPKVGVVQTRWEHINEDYSLITRLQAMQLNVHFRVEQSGRASGNCLLQFNGTAGVWRKTTINDAGGWEADTLTEDLDLSYRAQLKGWRIVFLEELGSPAELPAEMNGLKSQQFRWMKGGAENARKLIPAVLRSKLSFRQKTHAVGHLLASSVYLFIFLAGVFSVPLLFSLQTLGLDTQYFAIFLTSLASIIAIYYVANVLAEPGDQSLAYRTLKFIFIFPVFLALSMGLSLHNSIAVVQGYLGTASPFVRTPKFNIHNITDTFKKRQYLATRLSWTTIFEGLLALYFVGAVVAGFQLEDYTFMLFHVMLVIGYGSIFFYTVKHLRV
jgi:cellulose synthase/poly-beta-1,6-N-acetylglucosamine synthase-like glycosyltransferase